MKKNLLLLMALCLCALANKAMGQTYSGGSGTAADPFLISSNADMAALADAVNSGNNYSGSYFLLTQDITQTVTTVIGSDNTYCFQGVFDGGCHSINLNITDGYYYAGVFGYLSGATVKNLNIKGNNPNIFYSGGICGYATNATITNCSNGCSISSSDYYGNSYSGGICGYAENTAITNCSNTGGISSSTYYSSNSCYSGGICGYAFSTTIKNCSNTGGISSTASTYHSYSASGGICGYVSTNISIMNCLNAGDISSSASTSSSSYPSYGSSSGGIYGDTDNSSSNITVTNCLNTGDISSFAYPYNSFSGGICGYGVGKISRCIDANTRISGKDGCIGRISHGGTIESCYALSSVLVNDATVTSADATSQDGADGDINSFQSQSWITNNLQWDFADTWYMPSSPGYPLLKKLPNIRISQTPITYGETATIVSDNLNTAITYSVSDNSIVSITGNTITPLKAGTVTITASQTGINEFTSDVENITLTINKKQVTATANDQSMSYGDTPPAFSCQYAGFVNGETESVLTALPVYDCNATSTSYVGAYTIIPSGATAQNYSFTYQNGTLTIGKRALNVAPNDATRVYGSTNPTFTVTCTGFVNNETASVITSNPIAATMADITSSAGDYPITCSGGNAANYSFTYGTGTLTITKAPLTITAEYQSRPQGQANPVFTLAYSGFKNNETASVLDVLPTISCAANINSPAGFYDIVLSGGSDKNYDYTLVNGTLEVIAGTGIEDVAANQPSIFPNPVQSELFIKSDLLVKKIEICDISGRIVETRHSTSLPNRLQKISVSALSQGIYIVRIYTENGLITGKVVKE